MWKKQLTFSYSKKVLMRPLTLLVRMNWNIVLCNLKFHEYAIRNFPLWRIMVQCRNLKIILNTYCYQGRRHRGAGECMAPSTFLQGNEIFNYHICSFVRSSILDPHFWYHVDGPVVWHKREARYDYTRITYIKIKMFFFFIFGLFNFRFFEFTVKLLGYI